VTPRHCGRAMREEDRDEGAVMWLCSRCPACRESCVTGGHSDLDEHGPYVGKAPHEANAVRPLPARFHEPIERQ